MAFNDDIEIAQAYSHDLRQRKKQSDRGPELASRPFAGRIGGNQEFTLDPSDASFITTTEKVPDASSTFSWKQSFSLVAFTDIELYKEASIEAVGTCLQIYLSGTIALGLAHSGGNTSLGPIAPAAFGAIANIFLIMLFIYAGGPVSGGHFNPLITMSTFFARLSIFPRTVLYVVFQCAGAVVGGFLVRASLGWPPGELRVVPGCYINPSLVTPGQAYTMETMFSLALLFIAFGVGLDPRQKAVFGPAVSPLLIGITLALCTFASGIAKPGYSGASLNPARCLGMMAPAEDFTYHYIHWTGAITAAALIGALYWLIPIYKHEKRL